MQEQRLRARARRVLSRPYPEILRGLDLDNANYPWFFNHGRGAWLYDVDNRCYLDLAMGRGPNILGYGHPIIADALRRHAGNGIQTTLRHEAEVEVAEMLIEIIPCAEEAVFAKNGSDACTAAIQIARAATGKEVILSSGFHGFHDWFVASMPDIQGTPRVLREYIATFELNDLARFDDLCEKYDGQIAGIIVEPVHRLIPDPGFLAHVRARADKQGAVLIFDEVVTTIRMGLSGAQGLYGVTPDLACLGKAMANGYPLSGVVGKHEIMRCLDSTFFSMTYQADSLAFIVARACINHAIRNRTPERLFDIGEKLRLAFNEVAADFDVPARAIGLAPRMDFDFSPIAHVSTADQESIFLRALGDQRVIPHLSVFVCETFDENCLATARAAFEVGMQRIRSRIEETQ